MIYVIGAGGVGSWLTPSMAMLDIPENITVVDGDKLEQNNLNRQLFTVADIGKFKSDALAEKYECQSRPEWYSHGSMHVRMNDWMLVGVDNNPARKSVLDTCDATGCKAIFGANEVYSSEAYYYEVAMKDTPNDPRVYYPEILEDKGDDPRHAAIGCTGEVQRENIQLVSANFMAAALMQHLFVLWSMRRNEIGGEGVGYLPYRVRQNSSKYETTRLIDTRE